MTKQEYEETLKSILPALPQTNFPVGFYFQVEHGKELAMHRLGDDVFEYDYSNGDADDFRIHFITTFENAVASKQ